MVLSGPAFCSSLEGRSSLKECTLFECRYIYHESTNRGHYFYVSYWRRDRHFTWSSEPVEGLVPVSALRELSRSLTKTTVTTQQMMNLYWFKFPQQVCQAFQDS